MRQSHQTAHPPAPKLVVAALETVIAITFELASPAIILSEFPIEPAAELLVAVEEVLAQAPATVAVTEVVKAYSHSSDYYF